jgi:hypothetical protein
MPNKLIAGMNISMLGEIIFLNSPHKAYGNGEGEDFMRVFEHWFIERERISC